MPGIPFNATLIFNGATVGYVTGLQVETPQAVIVNMTPADAPAAAQILVPTGEFTGGAVTVDYQADAVPLATIGTMGPLVFSSSALTVTRTAILESATVSANTGEIVRGSLRFRLTDYTGA